MMKFREKYIILRGFQLRIYYAQGMNLSSPEAQQTGDSVDRRLSSPEVQWSNVQQSTHSVVPIIFFISQKLNFPTDHETLNISLSKNFDRFLNKNPLPRRGDQSEQSLNSEIFNISQLKHPTPTISIQ